MKTKRGIQLKDLNCIGVQPMLGTKGSEILPIFKKIFEKTGYPQAILKDGGSNLQAAVDLLNKELKKEQKIESIQDISHYFANLIKNKYAKSELLKNLGGLAGAVKNYAKLGPLAFLNLPKSRTVGRFMGYMKNLVKWYLTNFEPYIRKQAKEVEENSIQEKFLNIAAEYSVSPQDFHEISTILDVEESIFKELKNKGLNKKTHKKTQKILKMLPKENFYRVGMQKWLKKTWKIHEKLKITGSLTVTTDALESGNGVWKNILKRSPSKEATHLSLLTPLIFGKWTRSKIKKYLNNDFCKIREIKEWCNENLPISQRKLKKNPPPNTTKIINILPNIRRKKQTKDAQKGLHIH